MSRGGGSPFGFAWTPSTYRTGIFSSTTTLLPPSPLSLSSLPLLPPSPSSPPSLHLFFSALLFPLFLPLFSPFLSSPFPPSLLNTVTINTSTCHEANKLQLQAVLKSCIFFTTSHAKNRIIASSYMHCVWTCNETERSYDKLFWKKSQVYCRLYYYECTAWVTTPMATNKWFFSTITWSYHTNVRKKKIQLFKTACNCKASALTYIH